MEARCEVAVLFKVHYAAAGGEYEYESGACYHGEYIGYGRRGVHRLRGLKLDWIKPCDCAGLRGQHEFGCPGCVEGSDGHDRSEPRYRLFDLSDQEDGRSMVWYHMAEEALITNEASAEESEALYALVESSFWRDGFWRAFSRNMKATIYRPMIPATFNLSI